jgi:hypothetical protein
MTKEHKPHRRSLATIAKQVKRAGLQISRVEVEPTGKITIFTGHSDSTVVEPNPWDAETAKLKASLRGDKDD